MAQADRLGPEVGSHLALWAAFISPCPCNDSVSRVVLRRVRNCRSYYYYYYYYLYHTCTTCLPRCFVPKATPVPTSPYKTTAKMSYKNTCINNTVNKRLIVLKTGYDKNTCCLSGMSKRLHCLPSNTNTTRSRKRVAKWTIECQEQEVIAQT